jgi:microcystin-dependent protein
MASYEYTFSSGDTVTPQRINDARTVSAIVNADIDAAAAIAGSKLADDSVALAKLVASVQNALIPVGAVQTFARSTAPTGWLAANGDTIGSASSNATNASADYSALFAVLWDNWSNTDLPILDSSGVATTRGANAAADFSANKRLPLPDLRGIFVRGSGAQTISGATYDKTFAAKEADAVIAHTHDVSIIDFSATFLTGGPTPVNVSAGSTPVTTSSQSPAGATETRPANIALLYCIKF